MADAKSDSGGGQFKRFSGESLDGKELKKWKLWAQAKMAATKDLSEKQRGALGVYTPGRSSFRDS